MSLSCWASNFLTLFLIIIFKSFKKGRKSMVVVFALQENWGCV